MSSIQQLIPALEDCRKIPPGAFADSALVYARRWLGSVIFAPKPDDEWRVLPRGEVAVCKAEDAAFVSDFAIPCVEAVPAPTVEELLAALRDAGIPYPTAAYLTRLEEWVAQCGEMSREYVTSPRPENAASAALALWRRVVLNEDGTEDAKIPEEAEK